LLKEKLKKYFWNFTIFPFIFYVILINIKQYFYVAKKYKNPILKYPVFVKTSKIQKKNFVKKKKNIFVHTAKCLKAKKIIVFFIHQKTMF